MNIFVIINDAPYGTKKAYNALRLAMTLKKSSEVKVRIFLLGDSVGSAIPDQKVPSGYYNIEVMLKSVIAKDVEVKACGMCLEARGLKNLDLVEGIQPSTMPELSGRIKDSDKTITF